MIGCHRFNRDKIVAPKAFTAVPFEQVGSHSMLSSNGTRTHLFVTLCSAVLSRISARINRK